MLKPKTHSSFHDSFLNFCLGIIVSKKMIIEQFSAERSSRNFACKLITAHDDDFHYAMKHEKNVQQFQPNIFSQFDFLLNESNKYILGFVLHPI